MFLKRTELGRHLFQILFLFWGGLGVMSLVGGCATSSHIRFHDSKELSPEKDTAVAQDLARAARRVARDWDRLLSYQSHLPPAVLGISRIQRTGTMGRRFTMKYVGPVQPFISKVGHLVRWEVKVIGKSPASQPMIEIRPKKEPLYDILRDVGVQITPAAWIVLRPEGREIDIVYPPPLHISRGQGKEGVAR